MLHFEGKYHCECGVEFEWAITKPNKNELVFGEYEKMYKHALSFEQIGDAYQIVLRCPSCNKKKVIVKSNFNG